jgi:hypothetical protein
MKLKLIAAIAAVLFVGAAQADPTPRGGSSSLAGSGAVAGSVSSSGVLVNGTGIRYANNHGVAAAYAGNGCGCAESSFAIAGSSNTSTGAGYGSGISYAEGTSGAAAGAFQLNHDWSLEFNRGRPR